MNAILIRKASGLLLLAGVVAAVAPARGATAVIHGRSVTLYHARDLLGLRVVSSDGYTLGRIADYVFDFHGRPRLTDVIVATGPFGSSGEVRAVPAALVRQQGGVCRVDRTARDFRAVGPLPTDATAYFSRRANVARVDREFGLPARPPAGRFVTLSWLQNDEVMGSHDGYLGTLADALISPNEHEVFYLEVRPADPDWGDFADTRIEIPATSCAAVRWNEIDLSVPLSRRITDAPAAGTVPDLRSSMTTLGRVYHLQVSS